jgi:hypothetical protein
MTMTRNNFSRSVSLDKQVRRAQADKLLRLRNKAFRQAKTGLHVQAVRTFERYLGLSLAQVASLSEGGEQ